MDFDDELPFEIVAQFMEPGRFDLRVLAQAEIWVDRHATVHRLDEMSTDYQLNVLQFLRDHATVLHQKRLWAETIEQFWALMSGVPVPLYTTQRDDPLAWVQQTALYRHLTASVQGTGRDR